MKRIFDFICALLGLVILLPVFIMIILLICLTSKGSPFYKQIRVGQYNKDFKLWKFRSMYLDSEKSGLLTIGNHDSRITPVGSYLRKLKIDELPQLINVLIGDMSIVGPRPEVRKYVNFYTLAELEVLNLKPGITDTASIKYRNENAILEQYNNPEEAYINLIMRDKIRVNLASIKDSQSVLGSLKIVILTFFAIVRK